MLQNTFCHLPKIGLKSEIRLWEKGIFTWQDFLQKSNKFLSSRQYQGLYSHVQSSVRELRKKNADYFVGSLPKTEMWRLFKEFRNYVAYVDIETSGRGRGQDYITSIALYDGHKVKTYVHGRNIEAFKKDIYNYKLIVTYNGTNFDIPFLEKELDIKMPLAHIDLRFLLSNLGYKGGLKSCESLFGLHRGKLNGVNGYWAILLWEAFESTKDERILETLLAYNVEDVLSLEILLTKAYNLKFRSLPLSFLDRDLGLDVPQPATNPFQVHIDILHDIAPAKKLYY